MTQENKDLLLKDLCTRLPYFTKVQIKNEIVVLDSICDDDGYHFNFIGEDREGVNIEEIKPYLFPISSITEEQWKEITDIQIKESLKSIDSNNDYMSNPLFSIGDLKTLDWCYVNHLDWRGLIPMGLAIDATGLNIY